MELKQNKSISFIEFYRFQKTEYYVKRVSRDKKARETYLSGHRKNLVSDGLFVMDIIRKGLKNGDKIL